jgi:MFS family permease
MPAQSAQPAPRRGVGGVFVDIGPLRRHRAFRRLWTGQLASQVASQLTIVAVTYQTYRLTGSTAMVGLVSLGQLVPLLAGSLLGGPVVDAWDRRRIMLCTQVLLAVGCAGLAVNALLRHPALWLIFVCTAESAAFQGLDWSARRASLRQLVPPAELPAALSVQSAALQVMTVVGPAAAGLLIARAGFTFVYWISVASFGVAFVTVALLPRLPPHGGGQPVGLASLAGGIRYVRTSRPLAGVFLIDLGAMVFGLPRALFPALAVTLYGGGAVTVGYLNAAPGIGALVGSLLTGHVARVRRVGRAVVICVVAWGAAITAFGLVPWLPAALVLLALAGAADVISAVFRMVIVQQVTPDAMQGRVNSLIFAGIQGGPRLGDAEAGAAAALAGPQFAAWSGGVLSVLTGVAACWVLPEIWRYVSSAAGGPPLSGPAPEVPGGPAPGLDRPGPDRPEPDRPGPDRPEPDLPGPDLPEPDRPGLPG